MCARVYSFVLSEHVYRAILPRISDEATLLPCFFFSLSRQFSFSRRSNRDAREGNFEPMKVPISLKIDVYYWLELFGSPVQSFALRGC